MFDWPFICKITNTIARNANYSQNILRKLRFTEEILTSLANIHFVYEKIDKIDPRDKSSALPE